MTLEQRRKLSESRRRYLAEHLAERVWSKIRKDPNGCWVWTGAGASDADGYGQIVIGGRRCKPHRVAYELHNKTKIPSAAIDCV